MSQLTEPHCKPHHARNDIERVLIDRDRISQRISELGQEIQRDLDEQLDSTEIVLVPILTGSIIFLADLIRHLPQKIRISVVTATSYPGATTQSKGTQIAGALPSDLEGKHVLIVDDILDSGGTIRLIREEVSKRHPKSLRCCVLLRKMIPQALETPCEYIGFDIPNEFVVGVGLDYNNYYRNLPDICVLKKDVL